MNKKTLSLALLAFLSAGTVAAQDIYQIEQLSSSNLNGDARFVGMGGAMGALGANLSAISSNPASSALYRRNDFSMTASLLTGNEQSRDANFFGTGKTKLSFDQMGFVYAMKTNGRDVKFVNLGFNYRKSKNLKGLFALNNIPFANRMSQSWQLAELAHGVGTIPLDLGTSAGKSGTTPLANLAYDSYLIDKYNENGTFAGYRGIDANAYNYARAQWGAIENYDFNLSFNVREQFYVGVNLGVYNVDASSRMQYEENPIDASGNTVQYSNGVNKVYRMNHVQETTGTGVDAKLGVIVRPLLESPFRIGVSLSTPTFYSLTTYNRAELYSPEPYTDASGNTHEDATAYGEGTFEHRIRTPWKANFSLGHTIGQLLAVGVEYEIADHLSARSRYLTSSDYYGGSSLGTKDEALQTQIDNYLADIHTLRLGLEARLSPKYSLRLGYNYVSSPFKKNAFLNLFTDSPSYNNAYSTDYVNLGSTNRLTAGLGYHGRSFYADLAYQYQSQGADVYAFHYNKDDIRGTNTLPAEHLTAIRHAVNLTIGWRF